MCCLPGDGIENELSLELTCSVTVPLRSVLDHGTQARMVNHHLARYPAIRLIA